MKSEYRNYHCVTIGKQQHPRPAEKKKRVIKNKIRWIKSYFSSKAIFWRRYENVTKIYVYYHLMLLSGWKRRLDFSGLTN